MQEYSTEPLSAVPRPLLAWYDAGHRTLPWRSDPTPYHVWLSEIMLQQTRVEAVLGYYDRFVAALPTIEALAAAPEEQLMKLWEGLGYYTRARNLQKAAQIVAHELSGELPANAAALLRLPGIGPYSAGAIGSIAFGLPIPAVDGNVLRVCSRVCASEANVSLPAVKADWTAALQAVIPAERPGDFNQAMMELGAMVCLPNGAPLCEKCPLAHICKAHALCIESAFPVKNSKKPRIVLPRTIFLLTQNGKIALRRRPKTGLLAGLWELPGVEEQLNPAEAEHFLATLGRFGPVSPAGEAVHIFTHREWRMIGYHAACTTCKDDSLVWVSPAELRQEYCLPSAFRAFYTQLELWIKGD